MADHIDIEILEDGTISIKTSAVSDKNHLSADQLLDEITELAGGKRQTKDNPDAKVKGHRHTHNHVHTGHGHGHSHKH